MSEKNQAVQKDGKIHFHYQDVPFKLKNVSARKSVLSDLLKSEGSSFQSIDYIFCSDEFLIDLNKRFLNHDTFTDILTFNLSDTGQPIEAEIYISIDRVKENASKLGVPLRDETDRVMAHGLLHLCGYNDHTKEEIKEMRAKEEYYLLRFREAY